MSNGVLDLPNVRAMRISAHPDGEEATLQKAIARVNLNKIRHVGTPMLL